MAFNAKVRFQLSTITDWNGSLLPATHLQYASHHSVRNILMAWHWVPFSSDETTNTSTVSHTHTGT